VNPCNPDNKALQPTRRIGLEGSTQKTRSEEN